MLKEGRRVRNSSSSNSCLSRLPKFKPSDLITFRGYQQGAIGFLLYGTATGAVYFVVAPLFAAMLPDVKWSLGVVSTALLIRGLLSIPVAPLTGWLVARFGVRPVVMFGTLFTAVFTAVTGTVSNPSSSASFSGSR